MSLVVNFWLKRNYTVIKYAAIPGQAVGNSCVYLSSLPPVPLSAVTPDLVTGSIDTSGIPRQTDSMTEETALTARQHVSMPKLGKRNWIIKFMLVGGSGAVLNTAVLYVLHRRLHMPLAAASALAAEVAVVSNYLLHDRWTFAAGSPSIQRFAKFNVSSLGGLAVNVLSVWFLVHIGLQVIVADLAGIAAGFAVNCTLSSIWVWGKRA